MRKRLTANESISITNLNPRNSRSKVPTYRRWATAGVGQKYGSGYGLEAKARWMEGIVVSAPWTGNHDA